MDDDDDAEDDDNSECHSSVIIYFETLNIYLHLSKSHMPKKCNSTVCSLVIWQADVIIALIETNICMLIHYFYGSSGTVVYIS